MIKLSSIGSFFEEHVEKIILVIVGLVCTWLLITRVIFSPNMVSYNEGKFSPSAIDNEVLKEAKVLEQTLREPPQAKDPYKPRVEEFLAKLDSSISDIDVKSVVVAPHRTVAEDAVGVYRLPRIGSIGEVAVEDIRAVAYMPIGEVTEQNTYDKTGNEPNDIDFVSVQGKFDVAGLYDRFKESFVDYVEERWADPCLARPLFAAVQLQRQEQNSDGTWGQWINVPRAKIDPYRKLFDVVEKVDDLPAGGLKVRMLQYDYQPLQMDLLQPDPYQFATADEEWLPPILHKEYKQLKAKEALEEKRKAAEDKRDEQRQQNTRTDTTGTFGGVGGRSSGRRPPGSARSRGANMGYGSDMGMGGPDYGMGQGNTRTRGRARTSRGRAGTVDSRGRSTTTSRGRGSTRGRRTEPLDDSLYGGYDMGPGIGGTSARYSPIYEVYDKYDKMLLTRLTDFEKLDELTFWAHDDTVEPKKTYRYRIRLGVFNPIAGTDEINEKDRAHKDDVILWSDYSAETEPVKIMGRLYFFANSVREMDKAVSVQVAKLTLGRWHSHDFWVRDGEVIGEPLEPEPEKDNDRTNRQQRLNDPTGRFAPVTRPDQASIPEVVDYRTGAVLVDAVPVNDWSAKMPLRSRNYFDMLYSFDGVNIEHMPVGASYMPVELATVHNLITRLQRETQEPFKAFGTSDRKQRRGQFGGDMDEYMGDEYYMDEMYQMTDPMGAGPGRR